MPQLALVPDAVALHWARVAKVQLPGWPHPAPWRQYLFWAAAAGVATDARPAMDRISRKDETVERMTISFADAGSDVESRDA